jgi:hypothetical protein
MIIFAKNTELTEKESILPLQRYGIDAGCDASFVLWQDGMWRRRFGCGRFG